jgi:ABC-2 type transport system permease protein
MFFEIFKFELKYRSKRPATYIYFAILFLLCFLAVTTDAVGIGGGTGQVMENAPVTIANMMLIMSAFFMMITSAIMGVPIIRDFEHNTESIMFSNPIKKRDYLLGRFTGSFVTLLFVFSGMFFGFILGELWPGIGEFWPGRDSEKMLPFNFMTYWNPFLILVLPNLFFTGVLLFMSGAISRKMIVVYTQGVLLLVLYTIGRSFIRDLDNLSFAALIDPFAISSTTLFTRYWTVAEQNSLQIPLESTLLLNRVIWVGIGVLGMVVTYFSFSFNVVKNSVFKKKAEVASKVKQEIANVEIPKVSRSFGIGANLLQLANQSIFYFKSVFKEVPFLAIVISGMALMFLNAVNISKIYGADIYPSTYAMVEMIQGSFSLFFFIIVVFYTGELIWKERAVKIDLIYDATPVPDFLSLIAKFFGMLLVYIALIFILIGSGMIVQIFKGYYNFEIGVYLSSLFSSTLSFLVLFTFLAFFIQIMVNHKFLGHAVMVVFFMATLILNTLGIEHSLFNFGSASLGTYSDMNGYGHYLTSFSWLDIYWLGFACLLFALSVVFAVRGSESIMKTRLKLGKLRLSRPILTFGITSLLVFILSGCYVYYNTNVLNTYRNSEEVEKQQGNYEKTLKKFETNPQPRIVDIYVEVDLYPETRDFVAEGHFIMENKTNEPLTEVHIQGSSDANAKIKKLVFEDGAKITESYEDFRYNIYKFQKPLMPGDSVKMEFRTEFTTNGFVESGSSTNVIYNGTFFNNFLFPSIGYNNGAELSDPDTRKEQDLPKADRMLPRDDPRGRSMSLLGDDSDRVNFEIIMSTAPDQIAIAPGYLQKEWMEEDRKYFHYKMDKPILGFFSMVSAKYEVKKDLWIGEKGDSINLEIYYHKGHEYNLDRMMSSMKKSFDYFTTNFSPYQFKQMRIMEFPRYSAFAQSFANTVPFSEGIGFNLQIKEGDVDMSYYVTAHELAHQWWAHQVTEAQVQGNAMLSETMSQYSALMVMKQEYPPEMMQKFLKHELDRYLRGRTTETHREQPLELVERQNYIHYRKGSLIMYALQDYITEDSVNSALRNYHRDWAGKTNPYVSSIELVNYFREATPDSLKYIIEDMFETITLFENKTESVKYTKLADGKYELELNYSAKKMRADSLGITSDIAMHDWVDIGVFGEEEEKEKDRLIYFKKHLVKSGESTLKIVVDEKPIKAGIDPINKLIDRNPKDNVKDASELTSI